MSSKLWRNMNLSEKTQAYNKIRDLFPKGVTSTEEAKIMQLCEKDISATSDCIPAVIRSEISIDEIKLATTVKPSTETKTRSTFGERSVPEAIRLSKEYNLTVPEDERRSLTFQGRRSLSRIHTYIVLYLNMCCQVLYSRVIYYYLTVHYQ